MTATATPPPRSSTRWTVAACRTRLVIAEHQYEAALRSGMPRVIERAGARLAKRAVDMIEAERRLAERLASRPMCSA